MNDQTPMEPTVTPELDENGMPIVHTATPADDNAADADESGEQTPATEQSEGEETPETPENPAE